MSVGSRIKKTRAARDMTQEQLAKMIGSSKQAVYKYENEIVTNIPLGRLEDIAKALGVSAAYLMGWEDAEPSGSELSVYKDVYVPNMKRVPLLGKTACGKPVYDPDTENSFALIGDDMQVDFAMEAKGDSMTGVGINSGDIVFFRAQDTVDNGQIAAVFVDDETTLKRVNYYPQKNMLILKAENRAYEDQIYIGEELNHVRILGRAVAHMRKL